MLGAWLAWIVGRVLGVRRAHVLTSLRRARIGAVEQVAREMYRSLGTGVFELVLLALRPSKHPCLQGLESALGQIGEALAARQEGSRAVHPHAVVLATAHTGNWDLAACALARSVELTVITKRLKVSWLDRLWQGMRQARGIQLVQTGSAASCARASLARGGWVAAMIDQAPERKRGTLSMSFLGEVVDVDLAPALVAQRARCPLVVAFPYRGSSGHAVRLYGVLVPPRGAGRPWVEAAMRQATSWLEEFVRERPDQWLWMHRRWKRAIFEAGVSR